MDERGTNEGRAVDERWTSGGRTVAMEEAEEQDCERGIETRGETSETCVICLEEIIDDRAVFVCPRADDPCRTRCHQRCLEVLDAQPSSRCPTCRTDRKSPVLAAPERGPDRTPPPIFTLDKKVAALLLLLLIVVWLLVNADGVSTIYPPAAVFDQRNLSLTIERADIDGDAWDIAVDEIERNDGEVSIEFYQKIDKRRHSHPTGWGRANAIDSTLTVHLHGCELNSPVVCASLKVYSVQARQSSFPLVFATIGLALVAYIVRS